jgi:long-chain fatty acid transport protein
VNVGGTESPVLIPNGSAVFSLLKNERLSLGIGAIFSAGFQVDFPVSRLPSLLTNNQYDHSGRYANLKIMPAVSFKIRENLSIGAAVDINYAMFESDSAVPAPGFPETGGRSRNDTAFGIGGRIGLIYRPHPRLQIGAMYVTPQHFQKFDLYTDLIHGSLDLPQEVVFGLAVNPFEGATLLTDFKWINWSSGFLGSPISAGGLQWRDQYVFAGGFQYDFHPHFRVPFTFRIGYNYGRSPVSSASAFQNVLVPTVVEQHFTTGLSYEISRHIGFDAAYVHDFAHTVTDNGSALPAGTAAFVGNGGNAIALGIHGSWGHGTASPEEK